MEDKDVFIDDLNNQILGVRQSKQEEIEMLKQ